MGGGGVVEPVRVEIQKRVMGVTCSWFSAWLYFNQPYQSMNILTWCHTSFISNCVWIFFGLSWPPLLWHFYSFAQWSCSVPESLWDMPDWNPEPLPQNSGVLLMSHTFSMSSHFSMSSNIFKLVKSADVTSKNIVPSEHHKIIFKLSYLHARTLGVHLFSYTPLEKKTEM